MDSKNFTTDLAMMVNPETGERHFEFVTHVTMKDWFRNAGYLIVGFLSPEHDEIERCHRRFLGMQSKWHEYAKELGHRSPGLAAAKMARAMGWEDCRFV